MQQIIFGTKRLGKEDGGTGAYQKYPEQAVVTLEGVRGHGKSRRFLFNKMAEEVFGLEQGTTNQLIFGTYVDGDKKTVLIANANDIVDLEGLTIYKTSKNAVSYDDSKEKGKAVTSSVLTGDMTAFLGLDESIAHEFLIEDMVIEGSNIDAKMIVLMTEDQIDVAPVSEDVAEEAEPITTDNLSEVSDEVSNEVSWDDIEEGENPVMETADMVESETSGNGNFGGLNRATAE